MAKISRQVPQVPSTYTIAELTQEELTALSYGLYVMSGKGNFTLTTSEQRVLANLYDEIHRLART